jgi:phosphoglycolate phosphatase-like HAD superfamily hydrolase
VCDNDFDTDSVIFVGDAMSDWEAANENNIGFIARIAEGKEDILGEKKVEFRVRDLLELGNYIENRGTKYVCRK